MKEYEKLTKLGYTVERPIPAAERRRKAELEKQQPELDDMREREAEIDRMKEEYFA